MPITENVRFKGTRQGVHLLIEPGPGLAEVLVELDQRLRGSDQFFRSAALMLNLGDRELNEEELALLKEVLDRYGLSIVSALATHTDTRSLLRSRGIQIDLPEDAGAPFRLETASPDAGAPVHSPVTRAEPLREARVIHRTLRSGQTLTGDSDICLIGDVNPGAEIIAGANVIVWGSLRGVVQAGLNGGDDSVICALELAPTQLRIASLVTRQPEAMAEAVPEMARIVEGQIVVEQWLPRSRRVRKLR